MYKRQVILSGGNSLYFGEKRFGSGAFTFSKPFSDVSLPSAQLFSLYFLLSTGDVYKRQPINWNGIIWMILFLAIIIE